MTASPDIQAQAATTGPASGPLPASSQPIIHEQVPPQSFSNDLDMEGFSLTTTGLVTLFSDIRITANKIIKRALLSSYKFAIYIQNPHTRLATGLISDSMSRTNVRRK